MSRLYNVLAIVFLVLTLLACVFFTLQFLNPPAGGTPTEAVAIPTVAELPSITPTFTPTETPIPTNTPTLTPSPTFTFTPTATFTLPTVPPTATFTASAVPTLTFTPSPIPSLTDIPSLEPSATITETLTPTLTLTPGPQDTPTLAVITQQPLPPTPSPFPFTLRDQVIFTQNFANSAGCAWQGLGGQVFDLNGAPLVGIRVHVFGSGIDVFTVSGSNTLYGPSGWEIPLGTTVSTSTYLVELQTQNGTLISPQIQVTFPADCARNLGLVNFAQTRPF